MIHDGGESGGLLERHGRGGPAPRRRLALDRARHEVSVHLGGRVGDGKSLSRGLPDYERQEELP